MVGEHAIEAEDGGGACMTPEQYRERYQPLFKIASDEKFAPRKNHPRRLEWEMLRDAVEVIEGLK